MTTCNLERPTKVQLHLHPYFNEKNFLSNTIPYLNNYNLEDLLNAAEKKDIGVMGLERLNYEIYPEILERAKKLQKEKGDKYVITYNQNQLKILNKEDMKETAVLRATEYRTKQDFDVIVVGYSGLEDTKGTNSRHSIYYLMDKALVNNCLVIMDHPFCNARSIRRDITKKKEEELRDICRMYSLNTKDIFLEWNGYCIPWLRKLFLGGDVNKKTEEFAERFLKKYRKEYQVISDMDGHLRYKGGLNQIERGSIDMKINMDYSIIPQLKDNINKYKYHNNKKCVTPDHFVFNMGIQYVFHRYLKKIGLFHDSRA